MTDIVGRLYSDFTGGYGNKRNLKATIDEIERLRARVAELEALTDELDFLHHEGGTDSVAAMQAENERLRAALRARIDGPHHPRQAGGNR